MLADFSIQATSHPPEVLTYSTPINIDYQPSTSMKRTGADLEIVPFKGGVLV